MIRKPSHQTALDVLALLFYPPLLALLNSNWIFTPPRLTPDPWFYLAYFRYWPAYVSSFPSNQHYFVERLTWNVPGYLLYRLLPPEAANITLHLLVTWAALLGLYGVLRLLVSRRAALFAALLMAAYPWFLRAAGWDYTDGTGLAHFLTILFLLALAARQPRWKAPLLVLAGIVQASLLITNVFWVGFIPGWVLVYLYASTAPERRLARLARDAGLFALGALALTAAAALYYYSLTGDFFFLRNTLISSRRLTISIENVRSVRYIYGWMTPYWHVLPLLACLLAALRLLRGQLSYRGPVMVFAAMLAWCYTWFLYFHFSQIPYLIIYSYTSYLIPATFLLLGALAAPALERLTAGAFRRGMAAAAVALAAPLLLCAVWPAFTRLHGSLPVLWAVLAVVLLVWWWIERPGLRIALTVAAFSLLYYQGGVDIDVYMPDRAHNRDNYRMTIAASRAIDAHYPVYNNENFRLWYRDEGNAAFSVASLYLYPWGSTVMPYPTAQLQWPEYEPVYDGDIILLTSMGAPDDLLAEANELLAARGAMLTYRFAEQIEQGGQAMTLIYTRMDAPALALAYGEPIAFDQPLPGARNFYAPEMSGDSTFMWSGGPRARSEIRLALPAPRGQVQISMCVLNSILPEMPHTLRLYVNDVPVPLAVDTTAGCPFLLRGTIPPEAIAPPDALTLLGLQLDAVYSPEDFGLSADRRRLGLAFDWLVLEELP